MRPPHLFVAGLGYVGLRVGLAAQNELGWRVSGCCRTTERADALTRATGIDAFHLDLDDTYSGLPPEGLAALEDATHVLATIPPIADLSRDPLLALHGARIQRAASDGRLYWVGYLSTTSVYGDHDGAWVDEASETRCARGSPADHRLAAERKWLGFDGARGETSGPDRPRSANVFRLGGIYGPGRSALDTVAKAAARDANADGASLAPAPRAADATTLTGAAVDTTAAPPRPRYVSRIHVDDICSAVLASMELGAAADGGIFNLADDEPAPRAEVMAYAAQLLRAPRSAADGATGAGSGGTGARARRRAVEHKRVANKRMRATLLPNGLSFPSYREGLAHIAALDAGRDSRS